MYKKPYKEINDAEIINKTVKFEIPRTPIIPIPKLNIDFERASDEMEKLRKEIVRQYSENLESFIFECFKEMGYKGLINELDEIKAFAIFYNVEIERLPLTHHFNFGDIVTVSSKELGYKKSKEFIMVEGKITIC